MGKEMTPKEKAAELIERFKKHDYDWIAQGNMHTVKLNALIVIEEIQQTETLQDRSCGYLPIEKNHKEYWQQVKVEIENL